jgi:tetratricopeptide (TPR) repeat protein
MKSRNLIFAFLIIVMSCSDTKRKPKIDEDYIRRIEPIADKAYREDQYANSVIVYSKLISLDSSQGEYYFRRGYSYMMLRNTDSSIFDYQKAIQHEFKVSKAYQNIGAVYLGMLGNDSAAVYYLGKAVKADKTNAKALELLESARQRLLDKKK